MKRVTIAAAGALAVTATVAAADDFGTQGQWTYGLQMGEEYYSTGDSTSKTGGFLGLYCPGKYARSNGDQSPYLSVAIKGQQPRPGTLVRLTTSSRNNRTQASFFMGSNEMMEVSGPVTRAEFNRLWRALRRDDTVTISFADGRRSVLSLSGAAAILPAQPCKKQHGLS